MADPELEEVILKVLARAAKGKSEHPWFLSSYQILKELPSDVQSRLLTRAEGKVGEGAGSPYTAVSAVASAMRSKRMRQKVVVTYMDPRHVTFAVPDASGIDDEEPEVGVPAGYGLIGLYRLKRAGE